MADISVKDLLEKVRIGESTIIDVIDKLATDADGKTTPYKAITVTQRSMDPAPILPIKAPSPKRTHTFSTVDGFTDYLKRYATKNLVIFVDMVKTEVTAVLNEEADHGFEAVKMVPVMDPRWKPWNEMLALRRRTLDQFFEAVRQNKRAVREPDVDELILLLSQVKVARSITIERGRGPKALNAVVVETVIQGKPTKEKSELPEMMKVRTPIFVGLEESDVELDLLVEASAEDPAHVTVDVTSADFETIRVQAFENMAENIGLAFEKEQDKPVIVVGSPSWSDWSIVPRVGQPEQPRR